MHTVGTHDEAEFNYYEQAMISIVPVIEHYDNDKLIPFSGFGGKKLNERRVSHFFFLKPLIASHRQRGDTNEFCEGSLGMWFCYKIFTIEINTVKKVKKNNK